MPRLLKNDLVVANDQLTLQLASTRAELARCEAALEARSAENDSLRAQLHAEQMRSANLEAAAMGLQNKLTSLNADQKTVRNRTELMAKARLLSRQGVPCIMRGNFVYHAKTRAVLAQIEA